MTVVIVSSFSLTHTLDHSFTVTLNITLSLSLLKPSLLESSWCNVQYAGLLNFSRSIMFTCKLILLGKVWTSSKGSLGNQGMQFIMQANRLGREGKLFTSPYLWMWYELTLMWENTLLPTGPRWTWCLPLH